MLFKLPSLASLLYLAAVAQAHFVLQIPANIGFDDDAEDQGPCGSFSPTNQSSGVMSWPDGGASIAVLTTHTEQTWHISAALLSDVTTFVPLIPDISQSGVGTFCLPQVPGYPAWDGQDAVLQVIQNSVDGTLYQCAAIHFVAGDAASVPDGCTNSSGVVASYVSAGSSSSIPPQPSSTSSQESSMVTSAASYTESSTEGYEESSTEGYEESSTESYAESSTESYAESSTEGYEESSTEMYSTAAPSSTAAESASAEATSSTTATSTGSTPAQFTGASNNLQAGSFVFLSGGIAALIGWGL